MLQRGNGVACAYSGAFVWASRHSTDGASTWALESMHNPGHWTLDLSADAGLRLLDASTVQAFRPVGWQHLVAENRSGLIVAEFCLVFVRWSCPRHAYPMTASSVSREIEHLRVSSACVLVPF